MVTTREKVYIAVIGVLLLLLGAMGGMWFVAAQRTVPAGTPVVSNVNANDPFATKTPEQVLGMQSPAHRTATAVIFSGKTDPASVAAITCTFDAVYVTTTIDPTSDGSWTIEFSKKVFGDRSSADLDCTLGMRHTKDVSVRQTVVLPDEAAADQGAVQTTVAWRSAPVEMPPAELAAKLHVAEDVIVDGQGEATSHFYSVGTVQSGPYVGDDVLVILTQCDGPCFDPMLWRAIVDPVGKRLVNLTRYNETRKNLLGSLESMDGVQWRKPSAVVVDDASIAIPGLALPTDVTVQGSTYHLGAPEYPRTRFVLGTAWESGTDGSTHTVPTSVALRQLGTTTDGRTIFQVEDGGCVVLQRPDFTFDNYDIVLPFQNQEKILNITWNTGTTNAVQYAHADYGGCGPTNCYAVRAEETVKPATRLVAVGKTSTGETVYGLKDAKDKEYADFIAFAGFRADGKKISVAEAVAGNAILYWKDPFNRWVRFTRSDFFPQAECGKPVIYLYPEKEMPVHVSVGLKGLMSVSEPAHGAHGWDVLAKTDGTVVNRADGKLYPNLFWEGTGVRYTIPKQGFVIRGVETDAWLTKTLATIGFTARESAEFREFWVPRLPKTPYLFVTFVPQENFDRDAPLLITPRPDSISRVFMEYRGLEAPISVAPLTLPKIVRKGFSVVEWGGALR